jgi:hypothetical protein
LEKVRSLVQAQLWQMMFRLSRSPLAILREYSKNRSNDGEQLNDFPAVPKTADFRGSGLWHRPG